MYVMMNHLFRQIPRPKVLAGLAGCLTVALPVLAQDSNAPTVMKPTVITGSYIPVSEGATLASPVDIFTTTRIQEAGAEDILSALRKVSPSFTGNGNVGVELNNNSANPGEGNIALRNLPTLILLDGRRIANSALSHGTAVDIFTIPLGAIDRIEVLKDGASAQYGSDAVGGVVNIIIKKNYNGAEVSGRYGYGTDQGNVSQQRATVIAGATTESTRIFVGGDYFHEDPLFAKDRLVSSASIPYLSTLTGGAGQGIAPPTYFSGSFPGRVDNYILAGSPFAQGTPGYNPSITTPPIISGGPYTSLAAYNAAAHTQLGYFPYIPIDSTPVGQSLINAGIGSRTIFNTTQYGAMSLGEQDRRTAFGNFEHDIFEDKVIIFGDFMVADNKYTTQLAPAPIAALGPAGLNEIFIPSNSVYNPFGIDLGAGGSGSPRVRSRTLEFGPRTSVNSTEFYSLAAGLKGDINDYIGYEGSYNYSLSQQTLENKNSVNGLSLNQALTPIGAVDSQGRPLSALTDAAGNNLPLYNLFALPGFNAPETINALSTSVFEHGYDQLWEFGGHIYGHLFDLPAGKFGYALGGGFLEESLSINSDGLLQTGNAIGYNPNPSFNFGKRTRAYGFAQINFPIFSADKNIFAFHDLELTAAGRIEHLNPGGDSEVPQVGIKWQPVDEQITFRGTYSQGFVAPPLFDLFGPVTPNNPTVFINNPVLGSGGGQITSFEGPNPSIPPATSVNWNGGVTIKPKFVPGLTLTMDYYNVDEQGIPVIPDYNQVFASLNTLGSASPYAAGFTFADNSRLTTTAPNQITFSGSDPAHQPGTVAVHYQPGAAQRTDGFDLGGSYELPIENWGKITLAANANVIDRYEFRLNVGAPFYNYAGQYTSPSTIGGANGTLPSWFVTDSITWDYKGFTINVASRYIPEVLDQGDLFPTSGGTANGRTYNGAAWTVDSWYAIDMQLSYKFGEDYGRWLNGLRLTVGVNNLTDNLPPFIASGSEDNTDKGTYDILGRFVYFEIAKKF